MTTLLERMEQQAVLLNQPRELPLSVREHLAHAGTLRFLGLPQPVNFDAHANFAYSLVATAPSPATSGTSLVVTAADGAKFPAAPFNAVVWPTAVQPLTTNAEIVRVTAKSTDTFTITRTREGTSARSIQVGDQIAAAITAKTITDIETGVGYEIGYTQITSTVNITDTAEGTGTALISPGALTFDGAPVMLEVFCYQLTGPTGSFVAITLFEGATQITRLAVVQGLTGLQEQLTITGRYRFTPSAGSHTYKICGFVGSTTGTPSIVAGTGGVTTNNPSYVRFTKV